FLLRFLLKFPIFICFFLAIYFYWIIIEKRIKIPANKLNVYLFIIFSLPLFYIAFIWGSPIIIGYLFLILGITQYYDENKQYFKIGILVGLAASFSLVFLLIFFVLALDKKEINNKHDLIKIIEGFSFVWIILLLPYVFWNGKEFFISESGFIGFKEVTSFFNLDNGNLSFYGIIFLIIGLIISSGSMIFFSTTKLTHKINIFRVYDTFYFLLIFLIFFPFLQIEDMFILLNIVFIWYSQQLNKKINLNNKKIFKISYLTNEKIFITLNLILITTSILLLSLIAYFAISVNLVFHIDIIRLSFFAKLNQNLSLTQRMNLELVFYYVGLLLNGLSYLIIKHKNSIT
ncbi:MAG: hypothetical protein ACFFD1_14175, partial [Candidatus Thorarchaeota archaeon]